MPKLVFDRSGEEEELAPNTPIGHSCEAHGVPMICGVGICGTCICKVKDQKNLTPPTQAEIDFLGEDGVKEERMACQCSILEGDVHISF